MHRFLLLLMIALLPLRGWTADAMAAGTQPPMGGATISEPVNARDMHPAHAPCADHGVQATADHTAADVVAHADDSEGSACHLCQVCHSAALAPGHPTLAASALPAALVPAGGAAFASAAAARGFKPPIS